MPPVREWVEHPVPETIHSRQHKEWAVLLRKEPERVVPVPVARGAEPPVVTVAQAVALLSNSDLADPVVRVPVARPLQAADAPVVVVAAVAADQVVEQRAPSDAVVPRASRGSQSARSGKSLKCRRLPPSVVSAFLAVTAIRRSACARERQSVISRRSWSQLLA